jgi:hypothetical protein
MFSEAANRPLFEEPTSACERTDPWSGPKGFMFGGMGLPTRPYKDTAQQYFDAADLLISDIENLRIEDYRLANPIFFLYRHWLELMVKEIAGPVRGHDLAKLADKLDTYLRANGVALPNWVLRRFKEIAAIDSGSTTFRYGEFIPGETYVSLPHLRRAMAVLNVVLLSLAETGELPRRSIAMLLLEHDSKALFC